MCKTRNKKREWTKNKPLALKGRHDLLYFEVEMFNERR